MHYYNVFETASGFSGIAWSEAGITRFQLPFDSAAAAEKALLRRVASAIPCVPTPEIATVIEDVKRYFKGAAVDFSAVQLDLADRDAFSTEIYAAARRINWGHTTTYSGLASDVGAGREAARNVGQAMATNPVPLIIPCHRVLAAGGKLGGFSAPGGTETKLRMLELEKVHLSSAPAEQKSLF